MITCKVCGMKFTEEVRFKRHFKTHQNKKPKRQKHTTSDFDKPDFSQVM